MPSVSRIHRHEKTDFDGTFSHILSDVKNIIAGLEADTSFKSGKPGPTCDALFESSRQLINMLQACNHRVLHITQVMQKKIDQALLDKLQGFARVCKDHYEALSDRLRSAAGDLPFEQLARMASSYAMVYQAVDAAKVLFQCTFNLKFHMAHMSCQVMLQFFPGNNYTFEDHVTFLRSHGYEYKNVVDHKEKFWTCSDSSIDQLHVAYVLDNCTYNTETSKEYVAIEDLQGQTADTLGNCTHASIWKAAMKREDIIALAEFNEMRKFAEELFMLINHENCKNHAKLGHVMKANSKHYNAGPLMIVKMRSMNRETETITICFVHCIGCGFIVAVNLATEKPLLGTEVREYLEYISGKIQSTMIVAGSQTFDRDIQTGETDERALRTELATLIQAFIGLCFAYGRELLFGQVPVEGHIMAAAEAVKLFVIQHSEGYQDESGAILSEADAWDNNSIVGWTEAANIMWLSCIMAFTMNQQPDVKFREMTAYMAAFEDWKVDSLGCSRVFIKKEELLPAAAMPPCDSRFSIIMGGGSQKSAWEIVLLARTIYTNFSEWWVMASGQQDPILSHPRTIVGFLSVIHDIFGIDENFSQICGDVNHVFFLILLQALCLSLIVFWTRGHINLKVWSDEFVSYLRTCKFTFPGGIPTNTTLVQYYLMWLDGLNNYIARTERTTISWTTLAFNLMQLNSLFIKVISQRLVAITASGGNLHGEDSGGDSDEDDIDFGALTEQTKKVTEDIRNTMQTYHEEEERHKKTMEELDNETRQLEQESASLIIRLQEQEAESRRRLHEARLEFKKYDETFKSINDLFIKEMNSHRSLIVELAMLTAHLEELIKTYDAHQKKCRAYNKQCKQWLRENQEHIKLQEDLKKLTEEKAKLNEDLKNIKDDANDIIKKTMQAQLLNATIKESTLNRMVTEQQHMANQRKEEAAQAQKDYEGALKLTEETRREIETVQASVKKTNEGIANRTEYYEKAVAGFEQAQAEIRVAHEEATKGLLECNSAIEQTKKELEEKRKFRDLKMTELNEAVGAVATAYACGCGLFQCPVAQVIFQMIQTMGVYKVTTLFKSNDKMEGELAHLNPSQMVTLQFFIVNNTHVDMRLMKSLNEGGKWVDFEYDPKQALQVAKAVYKQLTEFTTEANEMMTLVYLMTLCSILTYLRCKYPDMLSDVKTMFPCTYTNPETEGNKLHRKALRELIAVVEEGPIVKQNHGELAGYYLLNYHEKATSMVKRSVPPIHMHCDSTTCEKEALAVPGIDHSVKAGQKHTHNKKVWSFVQRIEGLPEAVTYDVKFDHKSLKFYLCESTSVIPFMGMMTLFDIAYQNMDDKIQKAEYTDMLKCVIIHLIMSDWLLKTDKRVVEFNTKITAMLKTIKTLKNEISTMVDRLLALETNADNALERQMLLHQLVAWLDNESGHSQANLELNKFPCLDDKKWYYVDAASGKVLLMPQMIETYSFKLVNHELSGKTHIPEMHNPVLPGNSKMEIPDILTLLKQALHNITYSSSVSEIMMVCDVAILCIHCIYHYHHNEKESVDAYKEALELLSDYAHKYASVDPKLGVKTFRPCAGVLFAALAVSRAAHSTFKYEDAVVLFHQEVFNNIVFNNPTYEETWVGYETAFVQGPMHDKDALHYASDYLRNSKDSNDVQRQLMFNTVDSFSRSVVSISDKLSESMKAVPDYKNQFLLQALRVLSFIFSVDTKAFIRQVLLLLGLAACHDTDSVITTLNCIISEIQQQLCYKQFGFLQVKAQCLKTIVYMLKLKDRSIRLPGKKTALEFRLNAFERMMMSEPTLSHPGEGINLITSGTNAVLKLERSVLVLFNEINMKEELIVKMEFSQTGGMSLKRMIKGQDVDSGRMWDLVNNTQKMSEIARLVSSSPPPMPALPFVSSYARGVYILHMYVHSPFGETEKDICSGIIDTLNNYFLTMQATIYAQFAGMERNTTLDMSAFEAFCRKLYDNSASMSITKLYSFKVVACTRGCEIPADQEEETKTTHSAASTKRRQVIIKYIDTEYTTTGDLPQ